MRKGWMVALAVLLGACSLGGGSAASSGCQLTEVPGTSTIKDVLSGAAPIGSDVFAIGTRFSGSSGLALGFTGSPTTSTAQVIEAFGKRVVELEGIAGEPGGGAWAVGTFGSAAPAIAHLVGGSWIESDVVDPGDGEDGLSGVASVSSQLAWAVGRHQDGLLFDPLIERWDGVGWHAVAGPSLGPASAMLHDVAATGPNDAWAVGWQVVDRTYRTLAERWNGTAWTVVRTPDVGAGDASLTGVAAVGPDDVWAVGSVTSSAGVLEPLAEHWNGRAWSVVALPDDVGPAGLSSVSAVPGGVVVVGKTDRDDLPFPLALRYDGSTWTELSVSTTQPNQASLTGVAIDGSGTLWAVGSQQTSDGLAASLVTSGCGTS